MPERRSRKGKIFSLRGQEFYSSPSHWVRILFLRISNSLETISETNYYRTDFVEKILLRENSTFFRTVTVLLTAWKNIGFSPNGEGENKILARSRKGKNFTLRCQEFYSSPSHWVRILFLRISNSLETISFEYEFLSIFRENARFNYLDLDFNNLFRDIGTKMAFNFHKSSQS